MRSPSPHSLTASVASSHAKPATSYGESGPAFEQSLINSAQPAALSSSINVRDSFEMEQGESSLAGRTGKLTMQPEQSVDTWEMAHPEDRLSDWDGEEEIAIPVSREAIQGDRNGTRPLELARKAHTFSGTIADNFRTAGSVGGKKLKQNVRAATYSVASTFINSSVGLFGRKGKQVSSQNYSLALDSPSSSRASLESSSSEDKERHKWDVVDASSTEDLQQKKVGSKAILITKNDKNKKEDTVIDIRKDNPEFENMAHSTGMINYSMVSPEDIKGYVPLKIETKEDLYNETMKIYDEELENERKFAINRSKTIKGVTGQFMSTVTKNAFSTAAKAYTLMRDPQVYWEEHGAFVNQSLDRFTNNYIENQPLVPVRPKETAFRILNRYLNLIKPLRDLQSRAINQEIDGHISEAYNTIDTMEALTPHIGHQLQPFMKTLSTISYYARFPVSIKPLNNSLEANEKLNKIIENYFAEENQGIVIDFIEKLRAVSHPELLGHDMPRPIIVLVSPSGIGKGKGFEKVLETLGVPNAIVKQNKKVNEVRELFADGVKLKPVIKKFHISDNEDTKPATFEEAYGGILHAYIELGYLNAVLRLDEAENIFNTNDSITNYFKSFIDTIKVIHLSGRFTDNIPLNTELLGLAGFANYAIRDSSIREKANVHYLGNAQPRQRASMLSARLEELKKAWQITYVENPELLEKINNDLLPRLEELIPDIVKLTEPRTFGDPPQESGKGLTSEASASNDAGKDPAPDTGSLQETKKSKKDKKAFTISLNARQLRPIMANISQKSLRMLIKNEDISSETLLKIMNEEISHTFDNMEEGQRMKPQANLNLLSVQKGRPRPMNVMPPHYTMPRAPVNANSLAGPRPMPAALPPPPPPPTHFLQQHTGAHYSDGDSSDGSSD